MLKQLYSSRLFLVIFSALIFPILFYQKPWGLNLFLFQVFWLISVFYLKQSSLNKFQKLLFIGAVIPVVFTFIHHTYLGFWVSIGSLYLLSLGLANSHFKSLHLLALSIVPSWLKSPLHYWDDLLNILRQIGAPVYYLKRGVIFLIPLLVIGLYFNLYANSNPTFGVLSASVFACFESISNYLWSIIQTPVIAFFILGFSLAIPFFFAKPHLGLTEYDKSKNNQLKREKQQYFSFKKMGLKHEYQMAIFLLAVLNFLLILLLIFEAKDVWFGFNWNGQYLKGFVHEGMSLLTISILVSIAVVIYFFRGNLNFFSKNLWLKRFSNIWLGLNMLLVFSVTFRNFLYIQYFSLAYGRIFLLFFLAATMFGLYSVYQKINKTRNTYYLWKVNSAFIYFLLVVSTMFNWDVIIAKYNFSSSSKGFLHLNYLTNLNSSALPHIIDDLSFLEEKNNLQQSRLAESSSAYSAKYISPQEFKVIISEKKKVFTNQYASNHWLSWNYAEWRANELLSIKQP